MRNVGASVLLLLLAATLHVAEAPPAAACSCASMTDLEALDRADVVFEGNVVDYDYDPPPGPNRSSGDPVTWTFRVTGVYKGDASERQPVMSVVSGATCGLELPRSGAILVFARHDAHPFEPDPEPGALVSGLCDGSRALRHAPVPPTYGAPRPPGDGRGGGESAGALLLAEAVWIVRGSLSFFW